MVSVRGIGIGGINRRVVEEVMEDIVKKFDFISLLYCWCRRDGWKTQRPTETLKTL